MRLSRPAMAREPAVQQLRRRVLRHQGSAVDRTDAENVQRGRQQEQERRHPDQRRLLVRQRQDRQRSGQVLSAAHHLDGHLTMDTHRHAQAKQGHRRDGLILMGTRRHRIMGTRRRIIQGCLHGTPSEDDLRLRNTEGRLLWIRDSTRETKAEAENGRHDSGRNESSQTRLAVLRSSRCRCHPA